MTKPDMTEDRSMSCRLLWLMNIPTPYRNHQFERMASLFPTHGLTFEVMYMARSEPDRFWTFEEGELRYPHRVFGPAKPTHKFHFNPRLLAAIRRSAPDVLVVGGWSTPTSMLAPLLVQRRTLRLLWAESNADSVRLSQRWARELKRYFIERYDGYLTPGQPSRDLLADLAPASAERPAFTLPNLIDSQTYGPGVQALRADRDAIRSELGVKPGEQLWFCPARLEPFKGVDGLLRAMANLENVCLVVAGTGGQRAELEQLASAVGARARFVGQQDQAGMLRLYAGADLFVLPSLRDPSPLSPIEAIAGGLPLWVSVRAGNARDVCAPDENGWFYDPDDPVGASETAAAIASRSAKSLASMGERSKARYRAHFDTDTVLNRLADQIKGLWASHRGNPVGNRE